MDLASTKGNRFALSALCMYNRINSFAFAIRSYSQAEAIGSGLPEPDLLYVQRQSRNILTDSGIGIQGTKGYGQNCSKKLQTRQRKDSRDPFSDSATDSTRRFPQVPEVKHHRKSN